jgi:hypothetical protein
MIRRVITPQKQHISIEVPKDFIGKQVEVIVFSIEDVSSQSAILDEPMTHYASEKVLAKDWLTPEEDKAWENL